MSRKLLREGIEVLLEAKFGEAGVALIPKMRVLKTMYELRGFMHCLVNAETLSPVAVHLALKALLSR